MFAHVHLTRLCGCNHKQAVTIKGKFALVEKPKSCGQSGHYRIDAARFLAGEYQHRDDYSIRLWDDRAERKTDSEKNWMD